MTSRSRSSTSDRSHRLGVFVSRSEVAFMEPRSSGRMGQVRIPSQNPRGVAHREGVDAKTEV
jgi:hypothetical protein